MVGKGVYRSKEEKARIVKEALSNSAPLSEICRKYNVASVTNQTYQIALIRNINEEL